MFSVYFYIIPFVVVLMVSYFLAGSINHFVRPYFSHKKYFIIFSLSNFITVATLFSWALAIDLFLSIPYRPIEFIGEPFILPNIILLFSAFLFTYKQSKRIIQTQSNRIIHERILTVLLVVVAVSLLFFTRWDKIDETHTELVTDYAKIFNKPEACYNLNPRGQIVCIAKTLGTGTDQCEYFPSFSDERIRCIFERAIRNNDPTECLMFLDTSIYPHTDYVTYSCMSNFIGSKEWDELCMSIPQDLPNRVRYLKSAKCTSTDT